MLLPEVIHKFLRFSEARIAEVADEQCWFLLTEEVKRQMWEYGGEGNENRK
jgi:hypothetical protein